MIKRLLFSAVLVFMVHLACAIKENSNVPVSSFPVRLQNDISNQPYWEKGYLDVTRPPYNAAGNGFTDDSQAIQNAIDDAYVSNLVVFFPGDKTYLVSAQLRCVENAVSRKFGYQLVGSVLGTKPVIKLRDNSTVVDDVLVRFALLMDGVEENENSPSCYNHVFRGIDIDMGNNPTVSALSMNGNQYNIIEDVKIYGTDFFAGVNKIPGCGGGMVNLTVIGGRIGIYQREFRPEPTIFGLHLKGQSEYGIYHTNSRGPVVIAGFKIEGPENPSPDYRAIYTRNPYSKTFNGIVDHSQANLVLSDGSISVDGPDGFAIENVAQDLNLNNVYIKAATLLSSGTEDRTGGNKTHVGNDTEWSHFSKYRFTSSLDKSTSFVDRIHQNNRSQDFEYFDPITTSATSPATDFLTLHSWTDYLTWEDDNMVDIVKDFGATPAIVDEFDDDRPAIQGAIDAVTDPANPNYGKTVFIPRGWFHVDSTIVLKDGVKVLGASKLNSCIASLRDDWYNSRGPMITTENSPDGNVYLEEFGIVGNPVTLNAQFMSNNLVIKDIATERHGQRDGIEPPSLPYYKFSDNVGGKVYHFCLGAVPEKLPYGEAPKPGYHSILVENNANPLTFYQLNVAHLTSSPQVRFENAKDILIHGFKYEYEHELLHIINSHNIKMYGGAGNYQLKRRDDLAIIVIKGSTHIEIQNFTRRDIDPTSINSKWIVNGYDTISGDYAVLHFEITEPVTSIVESKLSMQNEIGVYPNPFDGYFKIRMEDFPDLTGFEVKIFSMMGKLVYQEKINEAITYVDTRSWSDAGVYLLCISDVKGQVLEIRKIMKYTN